MYAKYFNVKFPKRNKSWARHIICSACHAMLNKCEDSENNGRSNFTVPAI